MTPILASDGSLQENGPGLTTFSVITVRRNQPMTDRSDTSSPAARRARCRTVEVQCLLLYRSTEVAALCRAFATREDERRKPLRRRAGAFLRSSLLARNKCGKYVMC